MAKLRTLLSDKEESIVKINFELSVNRNNEILQKHSRKLKEKLEGNRYNNKDEFTNDVNEIVKNYNKEAKGEKKGDIIADFLSNLTVISLAMEKSQPDTSAQTNIALQEYEAKMKLKEQENESLRRQLEADKNASNLKTKSKLPNGSSKPGASGKEDKDNRSAGCCSGDKCIIM